ncbi:MAG: thioredoxin family protein [Pseudonocardiaceae bacterium]
MSVEVTEATFDPEVAASSVPLVLEFYATWCGNCRRVAPVLDELAQEFSERVGFVTVNADENPELVGRFGVRSTPTLFVLDDGGEWVESVVGAQPAEVLRELFVLAATGQRESDRLAGWVPVDACTLPTVDQPFRVTEFEQLFSEALRRVERRGKGWLRLQLHGDGATRDRARDLVERESECCSFFEFELRDAGPGPDGLDLVIDVRVPVERQGVLDGLEHQARAART